MLLFFTFFPPPHLGNQKKTNKVFAKDSLFFLNRSTEQGVQFLVSLFVQAEYECLFFLAKITQKSKSIDMYLFFLSLSLFFGCKLKIGTSHKSRKREREEEDISWPLLADIRSPLSHILLMRTVILWNPLGTRV